MKNTFSPSQSIDLTRLPSSSDDSARNHSFPSDHQIEYSAREISPPALLLQQLLRAHQVFLLHQASTLGDLFARVPRPRFQGLLKRYWDGFIVSWDVLLHGNPAVDVFDGIKLAAGGELGVGVGEEEWGSGEREVLEGFIGRTEGLVDVVVSRFGAVSGPTLTAPASDSTKPVLSQNANQSIRSDENQQTPSDGIVFSGIGALSRPCVRDISNWMERLHKYEQDAYGVRDNPSSAPRRKRRKFQPKIMESTSEIRKQHHHVQSQPGGSHKETAESSEGPLIPPSIVTTSKVSTPSAETNGTPADEKPRGKLDSIDSGASGTDTLMKYLTLGVYGSSWGFQSGRPPVQSRASSLRNEEITQSIKSNPMSDQSKSAGSLERPNGYFLIGLQGTLDESVQVQASDSDMEPNPDNENLDEENEPNSRVMMRTLHVERMKSIVKDANAPRPQGSRLEMVETYHDRLRVVVYVQKPFIFTFLFDLQTDSLAIPSFYRSLHHQLGPLQRPLLASTSPTRVAERLREAAAPRSTASSNNMHPVCDLVYDPTRLTVHTTIPDIPEPGLPAVAEMKPAPFWTRVEALSVHSQILNTFTSTRRGASEIERTCKTSRGWWVVWMRLPSSSSSDAGTGQSKIFREAFLIRKASDYESPAVRKSSGRFGKDVSGAGASGGWGPGKLAEGIGIDARQYIDSLLSLNR